MESGPTRCPACWAALAPSVGERCPFCFASLLSAKQQRELRKALRNQRRSRVASVPVGAPAAGGAVASIPPPPSPPAGAEAPPVYDLYSPPPARPPVAPAAYPTPVDAPPAPLPGTPGSWPPPSALPGHRASWGPPPPPGAEQYRARRRVAIGLAVALVASAAGLAGWKVTRPSAPEHPTAWDPRVADLAAFVENERGLQFLHPVHVDFVPDSEFRTDVTASGEDVTAEDRQEMEQVTGMMRALGLVDGDLDLLDALNQVQGEGILAYYDPLIDRIRVRGTELTIKVRGTLVHELTHALQDQHFDLSRDGAFPIDGQNDTYRPVYEGDAVHVEHAWFESLSGADQGAYMAAAEVEGSSIDMTGVPPAILHYFSDAYTFGEAFIDVLMATRGQHAVNDALRDPPRADADLLDPFRYLGGARVVTVPEPTLGVGEREVDRGVFGAMSLYLVLAQRLPAIEALDAVDAWGGDAYVNYMRGDRGCVKAVFTGKDTAGTTVLAEALHGWATGLPSGAATIGRLGDLIELNACDPGAGAAKSATGDLDLAVHVAQFRTGVAFGLVTESSLPPVQARCIAQRFITALSAADLHKAATGADLPPATTDGAFAAGRSCSPTG